jgi:hypothetical protein
MLLIRIKVFLKSLFFHIWAGFPKATLSEINDRYQICLDCKEYNSIKQVCEICGCNINNKSQFLNKLAWADQECPKNKWFKIIR